MKKYLPFFAALLLGLILGSASMLIYSNLRNDKEANPNNAVVGKKIALDQIKESTHLSKVMNAEGVYWQRSFDLFWNDLEKEKGIYDWSMFDNRMKEIDDMGIYAVVTIKPFANWDQNACHDKAYEAIFDPKKGGNLKVGIPCDMEAYSKFLESVVERYDGDGNDDMPGLIIPIKYWEIMNEPSMQGGSTGGMGEELKFFVGTSEEYLEILKTSYEVIKKADSEAKVLQGGQAGMQETFVDFWEPVFEAGGGDYFDIANIHAISVDERNESLFVIRFKEFLAKYDLEEKPIWLTEVQYGSLTDKPEDMQAFEETMVKSSVFALAQGADKLFYIENWTHWDESNKWGEKPEMPDLSDSSTHSVYLNLVDKINNYDKILVLAEDYDEVGNDFEGVHSNMGQYKFIDGSSSVFVLWGEAQIPEEITGKVRVTDIYGVSKEIDASEVVLFESPIFIELI
ncbi:MAG: hypothetical protein ABIE03_01250 [Patescibacteria group bacterium]|nr:hypothetical protein [Patescibacteria group bacterium]